MAILVILYIERVIISNKTIFHDKQEYQSTTYLLKKALIFPCPLLRSYDSSLASEVLFANQLTYYWLIVQVSKVLRPVYMKRFEQHVADNTLLVDWRSAQFCMRREHVAVAAITELKNILSGVSL